MSVSVIELQEIENASIRSINGGRIDRYSNEELRWSPYSTGLISLYNGKSWVVVSSSGVSVSNTTTDMDGVTLTSGINYDVYAKYQTPSSFSLELYRWPASNNRGLNGFKKFEGVRVYDNTTTIGQSMRFVGAVRLTQSGSAAVFTDSATQRFVVNWNNTQSSIVRTYNTGTTYSSLTYGGITQESFVEFNLGINQVRGEFLVLDTKQIGIGASIIGVENMGTSFTVASWAYNCVFINETTNNSGPWGAHRINNRSDQSRRDSQEDTTALSMKSLWLGYNWVSIGAGSNVTWTFNAASGQRAAGHLIIRK
jgi:hypothetical protein